LKAILIFVLSEYSTVTR